MIHIALVIVMKEESTVRLAIGSMISDCLRGIRARKTI